MLKEITNALSIVGIIQALVYSGIFISKLRSKRHYGFLLLFLLAYALPFIPHVLNYFELTKGRPQLLYFPFVFQFAYPAVYYLLVSSMVRKVRKIEFLHLVPGAIEFLVFTFFSFSSTEFIVSLGSGWKRESIVFIYNWVVPVYVSIYCILAIRNINWLQIQLPKYYSDTNKVLFNWFKVGALLLLADELVHLVSRNSLMLSGHSSEHVFVSTTVSLAIVYWISITGNSIPNYVIDTSESASGPSEPLPKDQSLYDQILEYLNTSKAYRKANFSIYDLSKEIGVPYRKVSAQINAFANVNFNQFINEKRIEDSKAFLKDQAYAKYSLEAIGEEVGFSSKSSFYRAFKKHTGLTPNEYKLKQ